jgi:hypothetical protein
MTDLLNLFPTILLGIMLVLTLVLLPLLDEERLRRRSERQCTDEIRIPLGRFKDE